MDKQVGSIVVTEQGAVVLLTATDETGEINGQTKTYDEGVVLGPENVGARFRILYGRGFRVASSAREVPHLLERSGVDLKTKAERPIQSMSLEERLERLEREKAALRSQVTYSE